MSRSTVVIELSPSRLEIAVVRSGRVVSSAAVRYPASEWEHGWPSVLEGRRQDLADLALGLDATGLNAVVLAATPTAAVNVHACPASAGRAAAESAAMLALGNSFSHPIAEHPSIAVEIARDRFKPLAEHKPQRHVLAAVETETSLEALSRWVESAGLAFAGALPLQTLEFLGACDDAAATGSSGLRAAIWVGEHHSVLAVGSPGRLRFVRPIALGTESLVEALTRPIIRRGVPGEPITLTREEARAMLNASGIPDMSAVVDAQRGLDGGAILPLLQPSLQRLGIEVKQTLRFGLSESERNETVLCVRGHGGALPGLQAAMQRHLSASDAHPNPTTVSEPAGPEALKEHGSSDVGCIAEFARIAWDVPLLLPFARAKSLASRRAHAAMRVGLAACLGVVAVNGTLTALEARSRVTVNVSSDEEATSRAEKNRALAAAVSAEQALSGLVNARLGAQPAIAPWLATLAEASAGRVRLIEVRAEPGSQSGNASVKGMTQDSGSPDMEPLREFINAMTTSPMVAEASLKQTQRSNADHRNEQVFEVGLTLVGLPAWARGAQADASVPEVSP
ncbi:MAG: hypothetical protein JNK58_00595 [Phycisphaerae bacterium]|nr:hypothetical protein [Phycisphaerae bacterium]